MGRPAKVNPWAKLVEGESARADTELQEYRAELVAKWRSHPWYYMTAVDPTTRTGEGLGPGYEQLEFPDGRPLIWTTDERDKQNPIKPFPADEPYLYDYVQALQTMPALMVTKNRQMYFSTCTLIDCDHMCRFNAGRIVVWSKKTRDEAAKMLKEKLRAMGNCLPLWLQKMEPMSQTPMDVVNYDNTGSAVYAANENMAEGMGRGGTTSRVVVDEAAYQHHTGPIVAAVRPASAQLVLITTPNISCPGGIVCKVLVDERRRDDVPIIEV